VPPRATDVTGYPDPYDLWATTSGVWLRREYYGGAWHGKGGAMAMGLMDWLGPDWARKTFRAVGPVHPITLAHLIRIRILRQGGRPGPAHMARAEAEALAHAAVQPWASRDRWAWGLGFPWISKHGLYGASMPLVTHTPYAMEALLELAGEPSARGRALELFAGTWSFLESLKEMDRSEDQGAASRLALSYGPTVETRIVINANTYAALALALHAVHGDQPQRKKRAEERALAIVRWVVGQQQPSGRWLYYADRRQGNFTDGFHSCIVIKNLRKVAALLPDAGPLVEDAIDRGWQMIRSRLFDGDEGLCQRSLENPYNGPFRWDLYDQAEYLGLLVDLGHLEEAEELLGTVEERFVVDGAWYCRIDLLGRPWGRNHLRWGIAPFWYHRQRLLDAQRRSADGA